MNMSTVPLAGQSIFQRIADTSITIAVGLMVKKLDTSTWIFFFSVDFVVIHIWPSKWNVDGV